MCYSKYVRKFGIGLRIAMVLIVLLAVPLSALAAWPTWLGGSEEKQELDQMQDLLMEKELQIESLRASTEKLATQLNVVKNELESSGSSNKKLEKLASDLKIQLMQSEKALENSKNEIAKLEEQLKELEKVSQESKNGDETLKKRNEQLNEQLASLKQSLSEAENTITTLKMELETLKRLSGLSEESYQNKVTSYVDLQKAHNKLVEENNELYNQVNGINGMIGASAFMTPETKAFGVEIEGGVSFGDITAKVGAAYELPEPFALPKSFKDMTYSAGVQFRF